MPKKPNGHRLTRKILKSNGQVVYRSTVRALTPDEMADETMTKEREKYNESVEVKLGESFKYEDFASDPELEDLGTPYYKTYEDDDDQPVHAPVDDDNADPDTYDQYVGAEVVLPIGDRMMNAKVRGRKRQADGTVMGKPIPIRSSILARMRLSLPMGKGLNSQQTSLPRICSPNATARVTSIYSLLGLLTTGKKILQLTKGTCI